MAKLKNLITESKIKTSELNNDGNFAISSNVPTIAQFNELKAKVENLNTYTIVKSLPNEAAEGTVVLLEEV